MISFLVSYFIDCQVILNRAQLAAWYPLYSTAPNIYLGNRNIKSIEASTFSNLKSLTGLYLSGNKLSSLHPTTFNSLTNLEYFNLDENNLLHIEPSTF